MAAFGRRVDEQNAVECPQLSALGLQLFVEQRKNGELCLQIRQDDELRWQLKSLIMGRLGRGDIVYEPNSR